MNRFNIINEDFWDKNKIEKTDEREISTEGAYDHELVFCIHGGNSFRNYDEFLKHFERIKKKIKYVVELCPKITSHSEIRYNAGGNKEINERILPDLYKSNNLLRIYAIVDVNANFLNLSQLDRFIKDSLKQPSTGKESPCLYASNINNVDRNGYNQKTTETFIVNMSKMMREYLGSEKPFMEMKQFYNIDIYDKVTGVLLGRHGNSVNIIKKPDLSKAQFNTVRLFLPSFTTNDRPTVCYHIETDDVEKDYTAYRFGSDENIKSVCNDALEFVKDISNVDGTFIYQQNGSFGGVGCIFSETYVYGNVEYIVVATYEFESPVSKYYISKDDSNKVKTEMKNAYGLLDKVIDSYSESLGWNNKY